MASRDERKEWQEVTEADRLRMRQMWEELFGQRLPERFRKLKEEEQQEKKK